MNAPVLKNAMRTALGFVVLMGLSEAAQAAFVDTFDGPDRDPAWRGNILQSRGLTYARPLAGALVVTDAERSEPPAVRNISSKMVRACGPIEGDFTATMNLAWDQKSPAALMSVMLQVLSSKGEVLAAVGLHDWWGGASANVRYAIGAPKKTQLGAHVPYKASGEFRIERRGDAYTLKLKRKSWEMVVAAGKGSQDAVAEVAISFDFFERPPKGTTPATHFGVVAVDRIAITPGAPAAAEVAASRQAWELGKPIVTYWAGPRMTDAVAKQMADGGWNLVWCKSAWELDTIQKHGLRGIVSSRLFNPDNLDSPETKARLDAFIDSVKNHPALYAYHVKDEPGASAFAHYARMANYLREMDPSHLAYLNLLPLGAKNRQLGTTGEQVPAYREYVRQFIEILKPKLLSYDHYHFADNGDGDGHFLNLAEMRQAALDAGVPFMVIVQACSWTKIRRIPTGEELRWLAYTTLAYGSQGISYYVYGHRGHDGAMINLVDGSPTPLYYYASELNKEFAAVAGELQSLRSVAVYHVGMQPPGTILLPEDAAFRIDPPVPPKEYPPVRPCREGWPTSYSAAPVEGLVIGCFGKGDSPTHALVVNLDYRTYSGRGHARREEFLKPVRRAIVGPGNLEVFDVAASKWSPTGSNRAELSLPPGAGVLLRVAR